MAVSAEPLKVFDTNLPADSVEFCPSLGYQEYFVCGTYQLQQEAGSTQPNAAANDEGVKDVDGDKGSKAQTRFGRCILLNIFPSGEFEHLQNVDMPAILDMKWSHSATYSPRLAIADAVGKLRFYELKDALDDSSVRGYKLHEVQTLAATESRNICLSLDWCDRLVPSSKMVASISDGTLVVSDIVDGQYTVTREWLAHDYEPWIAAWGWESNMIYSGGDDLCWKGWDLRTNLATPIFTNKKSFEGGVTSIQCHPHREHIVAIGSYDSHVRIFDVRQPFKPLTTTNVGGGAWRVKWNPSVKRIDDLLVACMHDGFKVIRYSLGDDVPAVPHTASAELEGEKNIIMRFDRHTSLAYGADWYHGEQSEDSMLIASCSFYDHSLMTWRG